MNYALPREEILRTVYQGLADKQTGCIPKIYPNFTDQFWSYDTDLEKAKGLLAEAGLKDGFKSTLSYNAGDPVQARMFMLLPIVFTYMLSAFPAGLVIYWAWNNLLSIAQQWAIMHRAGAA